MYFSLYTHHFSYLRLISGSEDIIVQHESVQFVESWSLVRFHWLKHFESF